MDRNEFAYRTMEAISSVLKERHGEITRVLKTLGHEESYLRKYRHRDNCESVKLGKAGALLEAGDIPPEIFGPRAFPEGYDPIARFRSEAMVLERRSRVPKVLLAIREHQTAGDLADAPYNARAAEIDELWQERITDPTRAGRRASSMARYGTERPFVARALGVWGAVLRMRGDLNTATIVLGDAIELAEGYPQILAELAQRAAYVASDRARYEDAVRLAEASLTISAYCADFRGIGHALVSGGIFHDYNGDSNKAIDAFSSALKFLPSEEAHYICTAHHGLAVVLTQEGQLRYADHHLNEALATPYSLPEVDAGRFFWLRARIADARGEYSQALLYFEKALSCFEESPVDYAIAATELVLVKLKHGDIVDAVALARNLTTIALQIKSEQVEAAVSALILAAHEGDLTIHRAKYLFAQMEESEVGPRIAQPHTRS